MMTNLKNLLAAVAVFATVAASTSALEAQEARRSATTGLYVGAHVNSTGLTILEPRESTAGIGTGIIVGYGISSRFGVSLTASEARVDNPQGERYTLGHADLSARYSFANPARALIPYLNAGLTGRVAEFEVPEVQGAGVTRKAAATLSAGGGLQYFLNPGWALDGSLHYAFGSFSRNGCPDAGTEVRSCATSTRLNLGVAWYPRTR